MVPALACAGASPRPASSPVAPHPEAVSVERPPGVPVAEPALPAAPEAAPALVAPVVRSLPELLPELAMELAELQAGYDIPLEVNEAVAGYVRMFLGDEYRPRFVRWLSRAHRYAPRFRAILREEGVPEDTVWLAMIESGFANQATSRAKAAGAWQFIPETGARYGLVQDEWVDERRDPEKAARAAARFLRALHGRMGHWYLAWASYNAGPNRIARAMELGSSDFWQLSNAPDLLPRETQTYVPKILAAAILAKHAAAFGIREEELVREAWIDYAEVNVARASPLAALAGAAGITVAELQDLNPELRGPSTPPRPYTLKLPRGQAALFAERWSPPAERTARRVTVATHQARLPKQHARPPKHRPAQRAEHRVVRGDTLWSVSRRHGVTVEELARWNGIRVPERHTLRSGTVLRVSASRR
jgi:membrane-bound lytic murein transglycosylase D